MLVEDVNNEDALLVFSICATIFCVCPGLPFYSWLAHLPSFAVMFWRSCLFSGMPGCDDNRRLPQTSAHHRHLGRGSGLPCGHWAQSFSVTVWDSCCSGDTLLGLDLRFHLPSHNQLVLHYCWPEKDQKLEICKVKHKINLFSFPNMICFYVMKVIHQSNLDLRTPLFTYFWFTYYFFFVELITLNAYSNSIYLLHLTYSNLIYVLSKLRIWNTGVRVSKYKGPIELHGDFGESVQRNWNRP